MGKGVDSEDELAGDSLELVRGLNDDVFDNSGQLVSDVDRHNGRGSFVGAESEIVSVLRDRDSQKVSEFVNGSDDGG